MKQESGLYGTFFYFFSADDEVNEYMLS